MTVDCQRSIGLTGWRKAHGQRCFREPVNRKHRTAFKTGGRQSRQEFITQFDADRFGAVENQPHVRQIQPIERALSRGASDSGDSRNWASTGCWRASRLASCSHSSGRRTNSSVGIRCARMRLANMIRWNPISPMSCVSGIQDSSTSSSCNAAAALDAADVGHQIGVREHHALGLAGRTGGELDEGDILGPGPVGLADCARATRARRPGMPRARNASNYAADCPCSRGEVPIRSSSRCSV